MRLAGLTAVLLAAAVCLTPAWSRAENWSKTAAEVKAEAAGIEAEAAKTRRAIAKERAALTRDLAELKHLIAAEERRLKERRAELEKLIELEATKREALAARQEEMDNLEAAIRLGAKDAAAVFKTSPVTAENPGRLTALAPLLDRDRFPGMDPIEALVEELFREMAAGGEVKLRRGAFIDASGRKTEGDIFRVGGFTAYFKSEGGVGYLRPTADGRSLVALAARPGWSRRRAIERAFEGRPAVLPLDLSGGAALAQLRPGRSVIEWLASGGVLIWPILAVALAAMVLMVERFIVLGRTRSNSDDIMSRIRELAERGRLDDCRAVCRANADTPACQVVLAGLESRQRSREGLESAVQEAILRQLPRLERFLPTLSVLAAIAPLLGLLGTVTGMIDTFQVITRFGSSDPGLMAGGISEALVTTQLGLAVAMPIIVIHHFLERRVDKIVGDMEEKGLAFLAAVGVKE